MTQQLDLDLLRQMAIQVRVRHCVEGGDVTAHTVAMAVEDLVQQNGDLLLNNKLICAQVDELQSALTAKDREIRRLKALERAARAYRAAHKPFSAEKVADGRVALFAAVDELTEVSAR